MISLAQRLRALPRQEHGDPYLANVVLLMHMDGANGSTTFVDEKLHSITKSGGVTISTAQSRFGVSSAYFNNGKLTVSDLNWSTVVSGDYTIEFWLYLTAAPGEHGVIGGVSDNYFCFSLRGLNYVMVTYGSSGSNYSETVSLGIGQWHHVAIVRQGTSGMTFINGVMVDQTTVSIVIPSGNIGIGTYHNGYYLNNAFIDELRITEGVARYIANFTPPTEPFPEG